MADSEVKDRVSTSVFLLFSLTFHHLGSRDQAAAGPRGGVGGQSDRDTIGTIEENDPILGTGDAGLGQELRDGGIHGHDLVFNEPNRRSSI